MATKISEIIKIITKMNSKNVQVVTPTVKIL